jgi:hypothetical protein
MQSFTMANIANDAMYRSVLVVNTMRTQGITVYSKIKDAHRPLPVPERGFKEAEAGRQESGRQSSRGKRPIRAGRGGTSRNAECDSRSDVTCTTLLTWGLLEIVWKLFGGF